MISPRSINPRISRKIQGRPWAARPIMTASAPVFESTLRACCGVWISPLATTGTRRAPCKAALTSAMVSYSASPRNPQARVRPCNVIMAAPASTKACARRTALRASGRGPVRILTVTGTASGPCPTASTTASTIRMASGSSASRALPAATLQTLRAGHPILISMI